MDWKIRNDLPIYSQLVERIKQAIVSGAMPPGARLNSVRDLATEAGVNPNTMQRALQELEREGLVYANRTAGRVVTEDIARIQEARKALAAVQVRSFLEAMEKLGCDHEEILALLAGEKEEKQDADL